MTDSSENATPQKSIKPRSSNSLVQIHIKQEFQFEFVPRNTEESEFHDLVDFGDVAISVQSVVPVTRLGHERVRERERERERERMLCIGKKPMGRSIMMSYCKVLYL